MAVALVAYLCVATACVPDTGSDHPAQTTDPVARACELDPELLVRLWRGHDPVTSEDVTIVPREPNFVGTFTLTSHSGPWDYLQRIPLVFYGPKHVPASGRSSDPASIVDVYPTIDLLLQQSELPNRDGRPLADVFGGAGAPPKLFVVIVWDGAGRETLERWPDAWPTLARLEQEGTSYVNATVGTSPSVTSAVHASLGTGAWPRSHKVTGNDLRDRNGDLNQAFAKNSADALRLTTFADEVDRAYGNRSQVGMLAWTPWHVGMLGHGAGIAGGDHDEMALIQYDGGVQIVGNDEDFSVPSSLSSTSAIAEQVDRVDRSDGEFDGRFLGHDISLAADTTWLTYWNPAWAAYQEELVEEMIDRNGYGKDRIPDFLFVNFKMTDLAGHRWGLESAETAAALEAQDTALRKLIDHLDAVVGSYVLVVTADHGAARLASTSDAWPIDQRQLIADVDAEFGVKNATLVAGSSAFGLYFDDEVMAGVGTTSEEVAEFLNGYTIADNWGDDELPNGYEERGDEQVFSAAYAKNQLPAVLRCAFGSSRPPRNARA